jgi:hypothetical protein
MKYPELVPDWVCTTPITITIESEGLTEDGSPVETTITGLKCNWQDGGKVYLTDEQKIVQVTGRAYFNGDICPTLSNITAGTAYIFGEKREIHQGFKRRNPDGTVNHTEIQFK